MKKLVFVFFAVLPIIGMSQELKPYRILDDQKNELNYGDLIDVVKSSDVCFFGELHNNPMSHWFEFEIMKSLYEIHGKNLVLGAEMFETDQQLILNEYLSGSISVRSFENGTKLWPNYETDYKQLVDFAASNGIDFIATNIPRRYASVVHKKGFEGLEELSEEAKSYLPPLPVPYDESLKSYADMLKMGGMMAHANPNLPKAQAIKDAAMAHSIKTNFSEGNCFLHFNGKYHSQYKEGIIWYLNKYIEGLNIVSITTVLKEDVANIDDIDFEEADYFIIVDENITSSY